MEREEQLDIVTEQASGGSSPLAAGVKSVLPPSSPALDAVSHSGSVADDERCAKDGRDSCMSRLGKWGTEAARIESAARRTEGLMGSAELQASSRSRMDRTISPKFGRSAGSSAQHFCMRSMYAGKATKTPPGNALRSPGTLSLCLRCATAIRIYQSTSRCLFLRSQNPLSLWISTQQHPTLSPSFSRKQLFTSNY